jgi:hypothetical protein
MKTKLLLILGLTLSLSALANLKSDGNLSCSAPIPLIIGPQSTVVISALKNNKRTITFKKNSNDIAKKYSAECSIQASFLNCNWKTGKISIDISHLNRDEGINVGFGTVGGYNYYESKATIFRTFINKTEKLRCRVK